MTGTVCPFCKSAMPGAAAACPRCGRRAAGSSDGDGLGDEDGGLDLGGGGGLDLSRGGSMGSQGEAASAYSGGGMGFGDDEDPFADEMPQGALELDLPPTHSANAARPMSAPASQP